MKKRLLSITLVLCMLLSVVPMMSISASAAPTGTDLGTWTGTKALTTGSYYLSQNVEGIITIASGNTVTLDLNGYVLDAGYDGQTEHVVGTSSGAGKGAATVTNNGTLTIIDSNPYKVHKYVVGSDGLWTWNDSASGTAIPYENLTARPSANDVIAVKGGAITGGLWQYGGGLSNFGTLTLKAGNVVGNSSFNNASSIPNDPERVSVNPYGTVYNGENGKLTIESGSRIIGNVTYKGYDPYSKKEDKDTNCFGNVTNLGTFNMTGGEICFNTSDPDKSLGGGVHNRGNFTMDGGTISHNLAWYGGGVIAYMKTFTMKKGTISNNEAIQGGGVICTNDAASTFIMEGGSITGNRAVKYGGGVNNARIFIMKGGTITGNSAGIGGGGVMQNGTMKISGNIQITDNTMVTGDTVTKNNVLVYESVSSKTGEHTIHPIEVSAALSFATPIGVNITTAPTEDVPQVVTKASNADYSKYFVSDNPSYAIYNDATGGNNAQIVKLGFAYDLTSASTVVGGGVDFTVGGNTVSSAVQGVTVTAKVKTVEGYSATLSSSDVTFTTNENGTATFTMPKKAVTVTATYNAFYKITYKYGTTEMTIEGAPTVYYDGVGISATDLAKVKPAAKDIPEGMKFDGWVTAPADPEKSEKITKVTNISDKVTGDVVLYARFVYVDVTLNGVSKGGYEAGADTSKGAVLFGATYGETKSHTVSLYGFYIYNADPTAENSNPVKVELSTSADTLKTNGNRFYSYVKQAGTTTYYAQAFVVIEGRFYFLDQPLSCSANTTYPIVFG